MGKRTVILVSGASGIVGYGILRSLKVSGREFFLIGTSIYDNSPAVLFSDLFIKSVPTSSLDYIDWLLKVIRDFEVDVIVPGIDADMYFWSKHRNTIAELGVCLLLNTSSLIQLCSDKLEFYLKLRDNFKDLMIPTFNNYKAVNIEGSVILKPRRGYGSQGIERFHSVSDLKSAYSEVPEDYIFQPIVGSDDLEFTVGAFYSRDSKLINYITFKRRLGRDGYTVQAEVVDIEIGEILTKLGEFLHPVGCTNFQFREVDGRFLLLEINPRISSSTSMRSLLGYNEAEMAVDFFYFGIEVPNFDRVKAIGKRIIRFIDERVYEGVH